MFLISLVSVLVLVNSAFADDYEWTGTSPYSVLFVDPFNWDPLQPYGPDDCGDRAKIGATGANPTVVVTAIEVGEVRGPAWDSEGDGDHEILLVGDAVLTVCTDWRVENTLPNTAYITLQDNAAINITGADDYKSFRARGDDQSVVITMSGNSEFTMVGDLQCGDDDADNFELYMTDDAYMYVGKQDDGFRHDEGMAIVHLSGNAVLECDLFRFRSKSSDPVILIDVTENSQINVVDEHFQFCGGGSDFIINLTDTAGIATNEDWRGGEDNDMDVGTTWTLNMPCGDTPLLDIGENLIMIDDDDAEGFGQINLHGGTINVGDSLESETDNWNIDICCNGILIVDGDVVGDIMDWHEEGNITVCGFGPCGGPADLMAEYDTIIPGKTVVWAEEDPNMPYDPDPPCDSCEDEKVPTDQCLSWVSGQNPCGGGELQHFVFLSTNYDKVANAPEDLSALVQILPEGTTTYCPGPLTLGACYYWRIVEVCDCHTNIGDIWCFCVIDCMVVEDMESYDESCGTNAVWEVWKDGAGDCNGIGGNGTGSSVYLAYAPVHDGDQSMEYNYDSTGSERECAYSLAKKTFDPPLNLVNNFEEALILYFYGDAGNDSESMWITLGDGTNEDQSTYGVYGDNPDDIKVEDWEIWAMGLAGQFPTVDLSNVETVAIGFGPNGRCDGEHPGDPTGTVYFDDIQLCTTICVPKYAPDGDINDDCVVDWEDVELLADDFLDDRR
jgi:hypothetical protein